VDTFGISGGGDVQEVAIGDEYYGCYIVIHIREAFKNGKSREVAQTLPTPLPSAVSPPQLENP